MSSIGMRYQLSNEADGSLGGFARRIIAFNYAIRGANNTGAPITVFDSMARPGLADTWIFHPGIAEGSGASVVLPPARKRPR